MLSFPNAKINLGLHVTRKRDDGFHDIETVFYPVQLHDALEILPSGKEKSSLSLHGKALPPGGENLCMKALHLLQQDFSMPPVEMHLLKHIPSGAGLGGGSSDAAYTLRMLNELFSLNISNNELENYAARLGSDCPFFINNAAVFASGRGEVFSPVSLDLSGKYIVIVTPGIHISTPEAFALITPLPGRPSPRETTQKPIHEWKGQLVNDFEKPVFEKYPSIKSLRDMLYEEGALYAAMSGSGSAVFAVFDSKPTLDLGLEAWSFEG
jgi:4-diphosphocytidyl-2-C-methyl-D-erythritol kinase